MRYSLKDMLLMCAGVALLVAATANKPSRTMIENTGRELDLAIVGEGYFTLVDESDKVYLTRHGRFNVSENGNLVHRESGYCLEPCVPIFDETEEVYVSPEGEVSVKEKGFSGVIDVGQLLLVQLPDSQAEQLEDKVRLFSAPKVMAEIYPGELSKVFLLQGWLECDSASYSVYDVFLWVSFLVVLWFLVSSLIRNNRRLGHTANRTIAWC